MEYKHLVLFNTIPTDQAHQQVQYVESFDLLNEAEDMAITLNNLHQNSPAPGEFDFFYVKTYHCIAT